MKKRKTARKSVGTGRAVSRAREDRFIAAMLANGDNQTQAAITAGYSKTSAETIGHEVARRPRVKAELAKRRKALASKFELTPELVLREVARIAYFDASKCFNKDGSIKNIHKIDEDTRRAISQVKDGEIKPFDKNNALGRSMQYLGLLPRAGISMKAQMSMAAAEVKTTEPEEQRSMLEVARRVAFVLTMGAEIAGTVPTPAPATDKPKARQPQPA